MQRLQVLLWKGLVVEDDIHRSRINAVELNDVLLGVLSHIVFGVFGDLRQIVQFIWHDFPAKLIVIASELIEACPSGLSTGAEKGSLVTLADANGAHDIGIVGHGQDAVVGHTLRNRCKTSGLMLTSRVEGVHFLRNICDLHTHVENIVCLVRHWYSIFHGLC